MSLPGYSVKNRVTMTMLFFLVIIFGVFSFTRLQLDLYPDMDIPYIVVVTSYVGASPADIETLISRPIEETAVSVTGVKNVMSTSKQNVSMVMLEFDWGYDMDQAEIDTRNKLDLVKGNLPDEVDATYVIAMDPSMQPIVLFNLTGDLPASEIRHIAEKRIQPRLERVAGISSVEVGGGELREIHVRLNPQKLEAYKISATTIYGMIKNENAQSVGGYIEASGRDLNIQTQGKFKSVKEIGDILLSAGADEKGQMIPIRLRDVAEIEDTIEESRRFMRVNDKAAVLMIASKQSGANTVDAANGLIKALPDVLEDIPELEYNIINNQAEFIESSISNLAQTVVLAVVIVFLVLLAFFRSVTTSLIVASAIPVSLLGTFGFMSSMGMTLNVISLAGLSLAVGMLVDNAIVTLENIFRHREEGDSAFHAAVTGAREIMMAITASTLTTVAVFLPILFVPGIAGMMFRDMSLTICGALAISLVVAITFVPMLSYYMLKSPRFDKTIKKNSGNEVDDLSTLDEATANTFTNRMRKGYERFLRACIKSRGLVTLIVVVLFGVSLWGFTKIPKEFMPTSDDSFMTVKIQTEMGMDAKTTFEVTQEVKKIVEKTILPSERRMISVDAGSSDSGFSAMFSNGVNSATIRIPLVKPKFRDRSITELLDATRDALKGVPGITYQVAGRGGPGGSGGDIDLEIYYDDIQMTRTITERIKRYALTRPDISEVKLSIEEQKPQIQVDYDREKLSELGLTSNAVSTLVTIFFRGLAASQYLEDGDEYDILVRYDRSFRNDIHEVENMPIQTNSGTVVPLSTVAHVYENLAPTQIDRKNQERYQKVSLTLKNTYIDPETGLTVKKNMEKTISDFEEYLKAEMKKDKDEKGIEWYYAVAGMAEYFKDSIMNLAYALIVSIFLVFGVMASQFESYREPFIVMFTIPLALIGVVGIYAITGRTIDLAGMIGIIMLVGIVVNNGIVLVDAANQNRDRGMDKVTAIVNAGRTRMRPVMMTALTTILSMIPLALQIGEGSETWAGMGTAVIGGLTLSTFFTLFFVPIMYTFFAAKNHEMQEFEREDNRSLAEIHQEEAKKRLQQQDAEKLLNSPEIQQELAKG
ncbi:MAG: efflux RND transporter permease subunit [Proteobacteria bacterium]|nr:efflux RND transporter permease subunit [Pseudomonadota bacterium]